MLPALVGLGVLVPWYHERPLAAGLETWTTPPIARLILDSDEPAGRFFCDPLPRAIPMTETAQAAEDTREQEALYRIANLTHDTPAVFGLRAAGGFSPLELADMVALRGRAEDPNDDRGLAEFCRLTGVRWVFTTPQRARRLFEQGLSGRIELTHRAGLQESVLVRLADPREAWLVGDEREVRLARLRPGAIEVELDGGAGTLVVAETFDPGWSARDQDGAELAIRAHAGVLLEVDVPPDTAGVHLSYRVPGLRAGLALGLLGACAGLALLVAAYRGRGVTIAA